MQTTIPERRPCPVCGSRGKPIPDYASVDLDRCQGCGLVFLGTTEIVGVEDKYQSDEYTDAKVEQFDEDRVFGHIAERRLRWLEGRFPPGGSLLELGPGRGYFLAAARTAGLDPTCVEPSPSLAARIIADFEIPVEVGFLDDVSFGDRTFDIACLFHVLEHVEDPVRMLRQLRVLLKPAGFVAVEVPNIASVIGVQRGSRWVAVQPQDLHISHFTPTTLSSLLDRAGFEVVEIDTVSPWAYVPPRRRWRLRPLVGYGVRAAKLKTFRSTHPTGFDNLRVIARPRGDA